MSNISTNSFTEEEKVLLLKIFRVSLPKDATSEKINETFKRLQTKLKKMQESDRHSPNGVDFSELARITVEAIDSEAPSPFYIPTSKESETVIQTLKKVLNEIPWTSIALETAKCVVLGSSPQGLAIAIGLELLMRVRFGNLFRGGASAIQVVLQNLNKIDPRELSEEAAKDAAAAVITVVKAFTKVPEAVMLKIEGHASKFFSAFSKELSSLAEKFNLPIKTLEHAIEGKIEENHGTSPTPFHKTPVPTTPVG